GGLLDGGCAQHLEDLVQPGLPDDVTHTDELGIVGGDADGQVALSDLEHEVDLVLALDGPGLDRLDERGTVVRVDDGLSDLERHVCLTPLADTQDNTPKIPSTRRCRRSEGTHRLPPLLDRR